MRNFSSKIMLILITLSVVSIIPVIAQTTVFFPSKPFVWGTVVLNYTWEDPSDFNFTSVIINEVDPHEDMVYLHIPVTYSEGEDNITYEIYNPEGQLYYTDHFTAPPFEEWEYRYDEFPDEPEMALYWISFSIPIAGTPAASMPGEWDIYASLYSSWNERMGTEGNTVHTTFTMLEDPDGSPDPLEVGLEEIAVEWNYTYGGNFNDYAKSVLQANDGGFVIVGSTNSQGAGNYDVLIVKTDSQGVMMWNNTYGGTDLERGHAVQQTKDGGYIIVGETVSYSRASGSGATSVYLVKTNHLGEQVWSQSFGETGYDIGYSVQQTSDNGYIIVGQTRSDEQANEAFLIKTDSSGYMEWSRTFGGISGDYGYHVQQTLDGGYAIAGQTASLGVGGQGSVWLIKTDSSGVETWNSYFGYQRNDQGKAVQQTPDGGYVIVGITENYGEGNGDVCLLKYNSEGDLRWSNTFGGTGVDIGYSMKQTSDGGFIIAGRTDSFGVEYRDIYLIKTNASGAIEWSYTIGGGGAESGDSVTPTRDGGYIIAGSTDSFGAGEYDMYLVKMRSFLSSSEYTINVDAIPRIVTEGESVSITGSTEPPLVDQQISLIVDGGIAQSSTTDGNGAFRDSWTFDAYGTHTVAVMVQDSTFVQESTSASQEIKVNAKPIAFFEYTPSDAQANEEVSYTDLSSDVDGDVVSWLWEMGSAYKSTSQNPVHSFTTGGEYEVSLVVTDSDGAVSDPYTLVVEIGDETMTGAWITDLTYPADVLRGDEVSIEVSVDYDLPGALRLIVEVSDETDTLDSVSEEVSWQGSGKFTLGFTAPSTPGSYDYVVTVTYIADDIADISEDGVEEFTIRVIPGDEKPGIFELIGIPGFPPIAIYLGLITIALLLRTKPRIYQ